jgi:hypothetical protein
MEWSRKRITKEDRSICVVVRCGEDSGRFAASTKGPKVAGPGPTRASQIAADMQKAWTDPLRPVYPARPQRLLLRCNRHSSARVERHLFIMIQPVAAGAMSLPRLSFSFHVAMRNRAV